MEKETWKHVLNFESLYLVSDKGRIMATEKIRGRRIVPPTVIKNKINSDGRNFVGLCMGAKYKYLLVHRLVAFAFIPNPDNLPDINHKDGNPLNNNVENLEWCTRSYNMNHSYYQLGNKYHKNRPIIQYDLDGRIIKKWDSISQAGKGIGKSLYGIWTALRRESGFAYGSKWKYES